MAYCLTIWEDEKHLSKEVHNLESAFDLIFSTDEVSKEEWDKLYTFGVIQNPFDRIIDMYEFLTEDTSDRVAWIKGIKDRKEAVREQHRLKSKYYSL